MSPKSIMIDPDDVRKPGAIRFADIPVNAYRSDPVREVERWGKPRLLTIAADMMVIREFETMLSGLKTTGAWRGISCAHGGPAHLSAGQEAASVGQAAALGVEDLVFGSHRSHGEVLAKCLSAVHQLDEPALDGIMRRYLDGAILRVVESGHRAGVRDLAADFVVYGLLAEILGRATGFNRGLGGSMHAFFAPFGSMPNNAIVGGSGDISVGAALFKRINRRPGIVIGNIGDASMGCGPVWEGIQLAAMDQYRTLWPGDAGGAPPILFNFFNNFYGMGGQTAGETMGFGQLARVGAGVNPDQCHAERIDGYNPLAVADAIERKKPILLEGRGPVLLDCVTYRLSGHSPSDASSYRTKEEVERWEQADCIAGYCAHLVGAGIATEAELSALRETAAARVLRALERVVSSPRVDAAFIDSVMYSNGRADRMADGVPAVLIPKADNPRLKALAGKARFGLDAAGKPLPRSKVYTLRDGLFEALLDRFYEDPTMAAWGEENRDWGGAFAVYRGLTEALPYPRLFNAPISEGAIVGSGVGYALCGGRAVVELMYCDFMGRAGDELFNQVAKWQAMSAGLLRMPLVIRISVGSKYGAQHSQDWTSIVAHMPGLKAMYPVTPYDAKGMLALALRGTDPVVVFESQKVYDIGELFAAGGVPEGPYEVPEGQPAVRRAGRDLTIITLGPALYTGLEAATELEARWGLTAEVIDLRFLNPLDYDPLLASLRKTGRVVLVADACERGSFINDVAAKLTQLAFDDLDGPPVVVGARNWIAPCAEMESLFTPQKEWILDAIHELLLPLPGHRVTTNRTPAEMRRRSRRGL
ncbi:MAG: thiamine pyrophosphate-dependent enzyme [Candidatus Coatesbacteria bacterium]